MPQRTLRQMQAVLSLIAIAQLMVGMVLKPRCRGCLGCFQQLVVHIMVLLTTEQQPGLHADGRPREYHLYSSSSVCALTVSRCRAGCRP